MLPKGGQHRIPENALPVVLQPALLFTPQNPIAAISKVKVRYKKIGVLVFTYRTSEFLSIFAVNPVAFVKVISEIRTAALGLMAHAITLSSSKISLIFCYA